MGGFALGAFFIGTLSDRLGYRKPVMLAAASVYCLCWLPWLFGLNMSNSLSFGLLFIMGLGASGFTLTWSCAKEVNRHALSGMATSVVNTGGFLGTAILQPLVGWAIDVSTPSSSAHGLGNYQTGISIMLGFAVMGWVAVLFIRETHCRYVHTN
jgi:MFS family permease